MDLNQLFGAVARVVNSRTAPVQDVDTGGVLNELAGVFQQHGSSAGQQVDTSAYENHGPGGYGEEPNILPASMDPYGDPADDEQSILPASQDPYGDPADSPQQSGTFGGRF